jgi:hypothetical protein
VGEALKGTFKYEPRIHIVEPTQLNETLKTESEVRCLGDIGDGEMLLK